MKKITVSLFIALSLLSLSGCGKEESAEINNLNSTKTYQGEINELPASITGLDVTHVLITESKDRVYLRSIMFDLDEYVDEKVRLFGNYTQEMVSGKPVDVLTVSSVDMLEEDSDEEDLTNFTSVELGLSMSYDKSKFEVDRSSTRIMLSSLKTSGAIIIKLFQISPEMDISLFIDKNHSDVSFKNFSLGDAAGKSSEADKNSDLVYILDRDGFFYEVSLVGLNDLDRTEKIEAIRSVIKSFNYIEIKNDFFKVEVDDVEVLDSSSATDSIKTEEKTKVVSKYSPVISGFQSVLKTYLPNFKSVVSYSFTDNNYFYIVYLDSNSASFRALFKYDSATSFQKIAEFEKGVGFDWQLKSGDNVAYDRPQTVIIVTDAGESREVEVEKGYRYFESLPLGFGMQYPQNWYYSRVVDSYVFSDKPIDSSEIKIKAELVKSSFDSATGDVISSGIKKKQSGSDITYNVKVGSYTVKISGNSSFSQQLSTMANSVREISNK